MEYIGLITKYPVNRPLTEEERAHQLKQKEKLEVDPVYQLSVVRMNSTFLESVDKFFAWKGFSTLICMMGLALPIFGVGGTAQILLSKYLAGAEYDFVAGLWALLFISAISVPLGWVLLWGLRKESFAYTHYPIRLNRKNRMVYVFRLDGTILSVPWDEVFFTLGKGQLRDNWDIRGHILDTDGVTVKETFSFSHFSSLNDQGLKGHWEYLRRYMEEGPKELIEQVEYLMPVANARESFWQGLKRLTANYGTVYVVAIGMMPISFLSALGRWFAMQTSKIPVWPQEVDDACRIVPNDPYVKEAKN